METTELATKKRDLTGISVYSIPGLIRNTLQLKIEEMWGLKQGTMFTRTRQTEYVMARHMYMSLCLEFVCGNLSVLSRKLPGGFDHATIIHSRKTCRDLVETDKRFREKYFEVREMLVLGSLTGPKI